MPGVLRLIPGETETNLQGASPLSFLEDAANRDAEASASGSGAEDLYEVGTFAQVCDISNLPPRYCM